MLAIFLYVGAEVHLGSFMINYLSLPQIGDDQAGAAAYVSLYWGGAMIGRFVGSALLRRIDTHKLLAGSPAAARCWCSPPCPPRRDRIMEHRRDRPV